MQGDFIFNPSPHPQPYWCLTDNNRSGALGQGYLGVQLTPSGTHFPRTLNDYYLWVLPQLEFTHPRLLRLIGSCSILSLRFDEGSHQGPQSLILLHPSLDYVLVVFVLGECAGHDSGDGEHQTFRSCRRNMGAHHIRIQGTFSGLLTSFPRAPPPLTV